MLILVPISFSLDVLPIHGKRLGGATHSLGYFAVGEHRRPDPRISVELIPYKPLLRSFSNAQNDFGQSESFRDSSFSVCTEVS